MNSRLFSLPSRQWLVSNRVCNAVIALVLLIGSAQVSFAGPTSVTATKDDGIPTATTKNPGDQVTYTIQINNAGGTDVTGVQLTDPPAANTADVAGTLNVTPVALDDTYPQTVFANMSVNTATSGFSVVTNDFAGFSGGNPVALAALTITAFDAASVNGGTVTMTTSGANVGRFTYAPAPGFVGTDTFTYTISNGVAGTPGGSATGIVSITVSGPVIWFVDSTAPGGGNGTWTGTNSKAFQTVAQAAAVDAANHRIFVLNNSGSSINYTDGIALNSGEWFIGQGAIGASFDAFMGISPGSDTPTRPSIAGVRPTIAVSSGTGITLASGNNVQGLNVTNSGGAGISGAAVGTLTLADFDVTITGSSTSDIALAVSGSGTITATGADNDLSATSGPALSVSNVTIGAAGLTFKSISSGNNTAAADPVDGIILNNTGSSGGLTVTGNSSGTCGGSVSAGPPALAAIATAPTTADCTGGTIQNTSGAGILLTSTSSLSLTRMWVKSSGDDGIRGTSVNGFTLASSLVENNGNAADEENIDFGSAASVGLTGAGSISNSTIQGAFDNNVRIRNNSGTLTSFTVTGSQFRNNSANLSSDSGLRMESLGNANMSINVSGSFFAANRGDQFRVTAGDINNPGSVISSATFTNNTLVGGHSTAVGGGITMSAAGVLPTGWSGSYTYDIDGNNINGAVADAINVNAGANTAGATFTGKVRNNVIGTTGVLLSCSAQAAGINVEAHGHGTHTCSVTNNTLRNCLDRGIDVLANDGNGVLNLTVQSNSIKEMSTDLSGGREAIFLNNGSTTTNVYGAPDSQLVCLNLGGAGGLANDLNKGPNVADDFRLRQRFSSTNRLPGYAGASTDTAAVVAFISAQNTSSENAITGSATTQAPGGGFVGGAACAVPPLLLAPGGVDARAPVSPVPAAKTGLINPSAGKSAVCAVAPSAFQTRASQSIDRSELSQAELDRVVAAALSRWSAAGLSDDQIATLRGLKFEVADLPDLRLGEANGSHIHVDNNAGGNGWFVDASTQSDKLFAKETSLTRSYTEPASAPAGRIDLLTAIMHEMGHVLGLNDSYLEQDRDNLMYGYLTKGERRLPAKDQARGATPHTSGEMHFLAAPVTIGTLPAGKSVVVTYTIMINPGIIVPFISNQGTVSGSNFSNVLTDDPTVAGSADPTVTLVLIVPTPTPSPTPTATATATATVVPLVSISGKVIYCGDSNPIAGVTMTLAGPSPAPSSTPTDALGNYTLANLTNGGSYTVTPSKAALPPSSSGINTADVIAAQKHYLTLAILPPGCGRDSGDVNGDGVINTFDVIAIQRFFVGQIFGTANVGQYKFTPMSRSYPNIATNQTGQDYTAIVLGDIVAGYVHRPEGGPSSDGAGEGERPTTVAAISLPNGAVDASVTHFIANVTTTAIDAANKLVGFQGDFTFDERVVTFQSEPVRNAGLTKGNWNVSGNVLPAQPGAGPIRTLRISGYSTDLVPLSGSGTLFELRMTRKSKAAQNTQLIWAAPPNDFIFIDADLKTQKPGYTASGGVKSSGETPAPPKAAPTRTIAPPEVIDANGTEGSEATLAESDGVLVALFQRTTPLEPWQRIRLE